MVTGPCDPLLFIHGRLLHPASCVGGGVVKGAGGRAKEREKGNEQ